MSPARALAAEAAATSDPGFGVYVHWPFCLAKCPYCDFNSHVRHRPIDEDRFRAAIVAELGWFASESGPERVRSVFFGGGTPSLMSPATVGAVIDRIGQLWGYDDAPEITLEANPTSVEAERFAGYRAAGVGRVSLGVQSLDDGALERLGRRHSAAEALAALDLARHHFSRVSFDLIYARPGQGVDEWRRELGAALGHAAGHLSLYQLTIEPGTAFFDLHRAGRLVVPDEPLAADLYEATQETCEAAGLPAYEISNHAMPGEECRHNLLYWQGGRWAGVGPGAHARIGRDGEPRRALATERNPEVWAALVETQGHGLVEDTSLSPDETADELVLMALRTMRGLDLDRHRALGGRIDETRLAALLADRLVEQSDGGDTLRLSRSGRLLANAVIAELSGGGAD